MRTIISWIVLSFLNLMYRNTLEFKTFNLPGGKEPKRMTRGAIGYDVYLRAIVSPTEMDEHNPIFRRTLFDFRSHPSGNYKKSELPGKVVEVEDGEDGELGFEMEPESTLLVGIGFAIAMPFPIFYWVAPRSGLSSKYGITVTNAPGTVDPDYRGEAGVLVYNRNKHPYVLRHNMRIAQIIFMPALIPRLLLVPDHSDLSSTARGSGGFGSTGIHRDEK